MISWICLPNACLEKAWIFVGKSYQKEEGGKDEEEEEKIKVEENFIWKKKKNYKPLSIVANMVKYKI